MSKLSVQSCKHVNDQAIYAVASACHSLREIDVSDCPFVTFQTLNVVLASLGELRRLNASGCEKNVELSIAKGSHGNLQEILISDCEVDDGTALSIANGCPNLRKLDISGSTNISCETILALTRCSQLQSLSFGDIADGNHGGGREVGMNGGADGSDSGSDHFTDHSPLGSIKDEHIDLLATHCPELREVEITGCGSLSGGSVSNLLCRCRKLSKLSLRSCDTLTDCIIPFGSNDGTIDNNNFGLRALELQNCGYINDLAILNIVSRCPGLKDLNLYGCFGLTDGCIAHGNDGHEFAQLQLLNLGNCRIGASGVGQIAAAASKLRVLILGNEHESAMAAQESTVTDEVLGCLGQRTPKLEHLDIYSSACTGVSLSLLSHGCHMLSAVTLCNCPLMTNLQPVSTPMSALLSLTVKECPINDQDIETIVAAAPHLTYFCVQNPSAALSGDAVRCISAGLRSLSSLCLSGCAGITDDVALSPMPFLQRLSLYDCHAITPVSCLAIVLASPKLAKGAASNVAHDNAGEGGATIERCGQLLELQAALPELLKHHLRYDAISGILAPVARSVAVASGAGAGLPDTSSDPFEGLSPLHEGFGSLDDGTGGLGRTRSAAAAAAVEAVAHAVPFATQRIMTADDSPTAAKPF